MSLLRRSFYLMLGFSFPFFWVMHATGFLNVLYLPIQKIFSTQSSGWPSLLSAILLYICVTVMFEFLSRAKQDIIPELRNRRQPPLSGHGSSLPDRCTEKEPGQPHLQELSGDPVGSEPEKPQ